MDERGVCLVLCKKKSSHLLTIKQADTCKSRFPVSQRKMVFGVRNNRMKKRKKNLCDIDSSKDLRALLQLITSIVNHYVVGFWVTSAVHAEVGLPSNMVFTNLTATHLLRPYNLIQFF